LRTYVSGCELAAVTTNEKGIVTPRNLPAVIDQINPSTPRPDTGVGLQIVLVSCVKIAKQTGARAETTVCR
jgi:hypothetical protein